MKFNNLFWYLAVLFASSSCLAQMYTVTDLGVLPGYRSSYGYGINSAGQVVGYAETAAGHRHAFLWSNGSMQDLGTLPGTTDSIATSINDAGQVVGVTANGNIEYHAFLWSNGSMQDLGTLPGGHIISEAYGVNNAGHVVGGADPFGGGTHPFLYANGSMQDLGTLGGVSGQAMSINNNEQVVGHSSVSAFGETHAFLWSKGSMKDLGTLPGGTFSVAFGINDVGQIVGESNTPSGLGNAHAFLWSHGSMQDLGTLPGTTDSILFAINNAGQAVGQANPGPPALLFANGSLLNLNTLIPANSGWSLWAARGINASGQITGLGVGPAGYHAFLLTPTTPYKFRTTTTLVSTLNPSVYGQKVTWAAMVKTSGSVPPTGKVAFRWSRDFQNYTIGTAALDATGVATLTRSNMYTDPFGAPYPLVAVYLGDARNLSSPSVVLSQHVLQAKTAARVSSSANPSGAGQAVTFTATITSPTVTPTGPVTFTAGKQVLGTAQIVPWSHKATLTIATLPVGSTTIGVTYLGNSNVARSSAVLTQTVR